MAGCRRQTGGPQGAAKNERRRPSATWKCPRCSRSFSQKNQRHACGTGDRSDVLRNRRESIVGLYDLVEAFAQSLGPIEIVARERYVLLRSTRIFADLMIMVTRFASLST